MKFNSYIWEIYKRSKQGQETIRRFKNLKPKKFQRELATDDFEEYKVEIHEKYVKEIGAETIPFHITTVVKDYASKYKFKNFEKAANFYESIVNKGIPLIAKNRKGKLVELCDFGGQESQNDFYNCVEYVSFGLYFAYPEYFTPYRFRTKFHIFQEICQEFHIPIPVIPGKNNKNERSLYYIKINQSLFEFRTRYGLSPYEMCAFLYDFAPNFIKDTQNEELPDPTKVWLLLAGTWDFDFLDKATQSSTNQWSGKIAIRRGDILLMYEVSPRSCIQTIWRANSDGFIDPFFHYHGTIWICSPIRTVSVTFKEMREHPLLSQKAAIKGHLQGPSGKPFSVEEYQAILDIMKCKGQDISLLPKIDVIDYLPSIELEDERAVETNLIEPFLQKLGYSEKDWIRQMPIKMGRGERNYPDYAFGANPKRGEESAKMVLESKFQLSTHREFTDAYYQAKSYALRLQSKVMAMASKEGMWVFPRERDSFNIDTYIHKNWNELNHPDIFHEVLLKIGRKNILGGL